MNILQDYDYGCMKGCLYIMEYKNLKISVIVPVYNVELYIKQCISSLLNQTYHNIELILVDDGSTDDSGKICDDFAALDNRVIVVHQENKGVSGARNNGISYATGTYLCLVDSDDWLDTDYFSKVAPILVDEQPDVLLNNIIFDYKDGGSAYTSGNDKVSFLNKENTLSLLVENKIVKWGVSAVFYNRAKFADCKFNNEIAYGEDLLFKYKLISCSTGKIIHQPIAKYHYRIREGSACTGYKIAKKIDDLKVLEYIMETSEGNISDLTFRKQYIPKLINYMYESTLSEDSADNALFEYFVDKIKQNHKRVLNDHKLSISKKLKVLSCFLPLNLLKRIVKAYAKLRSRR